MRYNWLLLDADGTLFNHDQAEAKALEWIFGESGHEFQEQYLGVYRQINEQIWSGFDQWKMDHNRMKVWRFELLFEAIGAELDAEQFSEQYLRRLALDTSLLEGAEEVLNSLYGKVGMVLITDGFAKVQRPRLARSTIGGFFSDVIVSEEVGVFKPDSKIFDVAFERMGNPKKAEVLMVGDSLTSDMRGGSEYGIDTCWYNPKGRTRELEVAIRYEIRSLNELLGILRGA